MNTALRTPETAHLDIILDEICRALQLTDTQFEDARQKYEAVGAWLLQPGTVLAPANPEIYPQGSIALRTTCRPWFHEEFDVDLVCQLHWAGDSEALYNAVGARLHEHWYYASILEPLKRCWRLNYAGEFHMDILPARPDSTRPGHAIEVPDTDLDDWSPSNPKDYAEWFRRQTRWQRFAEARKQEPLPDPESTHALPPLNRTVQLIKRHRDVHFDGDEDAPRSVALTTLAAAHYRGQESLTISLRDVLDGMLDQIARTPGIMVVPNPTNPEENFAEAWEKHPGAYAKFVRYIETFRDQLDRVMTLPIGGGLDDALNKLFGEKPMKRALERYAERMQRARRDNRLRYGAATGLTVAARHTRPVPRNTFFGDEGP